MPIGDNLRSTFVDRFRQGGSDTRGPIDPNVNTNALDRLGREQIGTADNQFGGTSDAIVDTGNQADRVAQADEARSFSNRASSNLEGQLNRRQRALGLNLTGRQQRSQTRRLGLTRAIAQASSVTGANRTSAGLSDQANRAGAGLQDQLESLEAGGLTQLANAEGQRNQRLARERAQRRAERNALIGQAVGLGAAVISSSEKIKDKKEKDIKLLEKLSQVRVDKWAYKGHEQDHVGPYAEEFNDTFGVNQENRGRISLIDAVGVALGSIKELNTKVESLAG